MKLCGKQTGATVTNAQLKHPLLTVIVLSWLNYRIRVSICRAVRAPAKPYCKARQGKHEIPDINPTQYLDINHVMAWLWDDLTDRN